MTNTNGWYDLSPHWDWLQSVSQKIHDQKDNYDSTRPWHSGSHFIGNCGEFTVTLASGVMFDYKLHDGQGNKSDFDEYDTEVKTSTFYTDPHLKHPKDEKRWPKYFVLVALDEKRKRSKIVGWCTAEELKAGELRDYGNGLQYSLDDTYLNPGLPPTYSKI
jgi:hypothetical protein